VRAPTSAADSGGSRVSAGDSQPPALPVRSSSLGVLTRVMPRAQAAAFLLAASTAAAGTSTSTAPAATSANAGTAPASAPLTLAAAVSVPALVMPPGSPEHVDDDNDSVGVGDAFDAGAEPPPAPLSFASFSDLNAFFTALEQDYIVDLQV
jgi:hypothetical protein